jgi:hypothetical protein
MLARATGRGRGPPPRASSQTFSGPSGPEPRTRRGALEDDQLVPQREVLEHQGLAGPEHAEEAGEDEGIMPGHHRPDRPKVNADKADGVSGRHRRSPPPRARTSVGGISWAAYCANITRTRRESGFVHPSRIAIDSNCPPGLKPRHAGAAVITNIFVNSSHAEVSGRELRTASMTSRAIGVWSASSL